MDTPAEIKQQLDSLLQFVDAAHEAAHAGRQIDMSGMDLEIAGLCEKVMALPPGDSEQVAKGMNDLVNKLEALKETLITSAKSDDHGG